MDASEAITILPDGAAAATNLQSPVYFPSDIARGVICLITPEGRQLQAGPAFLDFDDGTNLVVIGVVTNSVGELISSNQVLYPDILRGSGLRADLLCTVRKSGFESCLVFRAQIPDPTSLGLGANARLQLGTEFFNPPEPVQTASGANRTDGLTDTTLRFGSTVMGRGKAFVVGSQESERGSQTPVYKSWLHLQGRTFLIEELPYQRIRAQLQTLPTPAATPTAISQFLSSKFASANRPLPPACEIAPSKSQIQIASVNLNKQPGVVLDYVELNSGQTNMTFESGTYLISGIVNLSGVTTFADNAVIKYNDDGSLVLDGSALAPDGNVGIVCPDSPDQPAVFTSVDDNSVGQAIGSGTPALNNACYIFFPWCSGTPPCHLKNVRFSYAGCALWDAFENGGMYWNISDCEFIRCGCVVWTSASLLQLNNDLFSGCQIVVGSDCGTEIDGVNITADSCASFSCDPVGNGSYVQLINSFISSITNFTTAMPGMGYYGEVYMQNSLIAGCTNWNQSITSVPFVYNVPSGCSEIPSGLYTRPTYVLSSQNSSQISSASGLYQTAANANYFLATNSPYRDIGTTNIDLGLLAEFPTLTTYAPQDGSWPDTNAPDLGYHYPINEDSDCDGLPDWWEWKYYANFSLSGTNSDGVGYTLLDDYIENIDPNFILFSLQFTNSDVSSSSASGTINLQAGVPFYEAELVNDTNSAHANWQPFTSTTLTVNLSNGLCTVAVGLSGLPSNARQTWREVQLTVNTTPLSLAVTNPASPTVYTPVIQLQGYASKPFSSLAYDISNATGILTNQAGYSTSTFYDTNWGILTTNYFQCYDLRLTNGLNTITLHATDLAGNTATADFGFTLDSGDTNPPALSLIWPQNGMKISGSNFTAQAQVDDATVTAVASLNGDPNTIAGLVERSGTVWFKNLPLAAGTNSLTIIVTNSAGNMSATTIEIVKSSVMLTIAPISDDQRNQSFVTVTGTVDNPGDTVTVNGIPASVDSSGNWTVTNVPVNPTGTASLDVEATDADDIPLGSQKLDEPQPPMVVLASYQLRTGNSSNGNGQNQTVQWDWQAGGSWSVTSYQSMSDWTEDGHDPEIPPDGAGYTPPVVTSDQGETFAPTWQNAQDSKTENGINYHAWIRTGLMIVPGGQTEANGTALYLVQLAGKKFSSLANDPNITGLHLGGSAEGDWPMPPEWLRVNNQTVVNSGITNADGSIVGYALVSGSAGAPAPFTVTATQYYTNSDYTFNGIQVSNVTVQSLTVVSNSATQIDATNWATVKTPTNDYVMVQVALSITNDWFLTNAALQAEAGAAIQWTGGEPVAGNPLQCRVSKIVSTNITVTATLGSSSASLNVWVIWSTISYQFSGTTPLNAQGLWTNLNSSGDSNSDLSLFCPGVILGVQNYFTNLWPLGYTWPVGNGIGYSAWAKMCVIATLTPSGIGGLITNDWKICQMFMAHEFPDRTTNTTAYFDGWNDDSPGDHRRTHIPVDDKVYAIDAPPIEENQYYITLNRTSAVCTNSFEMHDNFYNYVAWIWAGTTNICSLTNNFWHFQGGWANGQTQISPVDLGTNSIIPLPTSPQY